MLIHDGHPQNICRYMMATLKIYVGHDGHFQNIYRYMMSTLARLVHPQNVIITSNEQWEGNPTKSLCSFSYCLKYINVNSQLDPDCTFPLFFFLNYLGLQSDKWPPNILHGCFNAKNFIFCIKLCMQF